MLVNWSCFLPIILLAGPGSAYVRKPTYRLEVEQETDASGFAHCTFVGLTGTHLHKSLQRVDSPYIKKTGNVNHEERSIQAPDSATYAHYYSHDPDLLWSIAQNDCGAPGTWEFPAFISTLSRGMETARLPDADQMVLRSRLGEEVQNPLTASMGPTILRRLIISGPSENRINFVFFGDGCMWPFH